MDEIYTILGASGGGAGVVAALKWMHSRIEKKADVSMCDQKHKQIDNELKKGDDQFRKLAEKLNTTNEAIIRLETKLEIWMDKNGSTTR